MKSLFDKTLLQETRARVAKLTPLNSRKWGTLTPDRVLAHFLDAMEMCFGEREVEVKRGFPNSALGRWLVITLPLPIPKNIKSTLTPKVVPGDFEKDKQRLMDYLFRFSRGREQKWGAHPAFGNLTPDQWARLQYRHFDHHLTQFGC